MTAQVGSESTTQHASVGVPPITPTPVTRLAALDTAETEYTRLLTEGLDRRILDDPTTALAVIQDALQGAREDLLILDPYFGHMPADWAVLLNVPVPVRVLTMHRQFAKAASATKPAQPAVLIPIPAQTDIQHLHRRPQTAHRAAAMPAVAARRTERAARLHRPPPQITAPAAVTAAASTGSPDAGGARPPSPPRCTASPAPRPGPAWRPAPRSGTRPAQHAAPPPAPAGSDPSATAAPHRETAHTPETRHHTGRPGAAPHPHLFLRRTKLGEQHARIGHGPAPPALALRHGRSVTPAMRLAPRISPPPARTPHPAAGNRPAPRFLSAPRRSARVFQPATAESRPAPLQQRAVHRPAK